jgi:pilus assembly protein TadC
MTGLALAALALGLGLFVIPPGGGAAVRLGALRPSPAPPVRLSWQRPGWLPRRRAPRRAADALAVAAHWDLLTACLRAGLPVADALRAVAGGLPDEAAGALQRTSDLIALGAAAEDAWQPAVDCPDTAALAGAARRSARSGTALAGAAAELAQRMRAELTDAAEARAQRAGVLITGPLGLCFLPGFLCLGVVPVVLGLAGQLAVLR